MRIACSRCQTHYEVPSEKLGRGAVKVQCSQCGHLFVVRKRSAEREELQSETADEARFEDFDFGRIDEAASVEPLAESEALSKSETLPEPDMPAPEPDVFSDDALGSLGELDLGDFDSLDGELDLAEAGSADEERLAQAEDPVERVREEELVSARSGDVRLQNLAEDMPRLNIQRGPRRSDGAVPSPIVARDRRRSPLFWIVLIAAVGTLAFTGYNIYKHPDKAFSFLHPSQIRKLWQTHQMEARLGKEDLQGYYKEFPAGRHFFVIRGDVVNRSPNPQSLIRVEGNLFAPDGGTLASRVVYCGNVLTEQELKTLSDETIEARLQNKVGEGFSNMDIAPGGRVPFMVVFPSPPPRVEKYNVTVTAAQAGSSS